MSLQELSIGNDLKDQFKPTQKWINSGISWLLDLDGFYKERATIEQEYAAKLNDLTKRHFSKKAKHSSSLSVGDEPQITPGSLESASVVLWNEVLTQTEKIANERNKLANEFTLNIASNIIQLQSKCLNISKHIEIIHDFLSAEKTRVEDEVSRSKKHYDSLCQSTENARVKTEKSLNERYQAKLKEKEVEMNIGKNAYLIAISQANRLKDKYYFQDLPEILDYYQDLNETRTTILNKILKNASIVERNSNDKVKDLLYDIDTVIDQNNPKLDVAMYIKHNSRTWKEPNDFVFEPCSFWHDDESLVTKEPELTDLKKRLNLTISKYNIGKENTLAAKQKLEEMAQERSNSEDNQSLRFDLRLDDVLTLLHKFMKEDSERVRLEVEIEIIQNFAGDQDMSYYEEAQPKKSRFGLFKSKKGHTSDQASDAHSLHTVKSNVTTHSGGLFSLRRKKTIASNGESSPTGGSGATANYPYEADGDDEISLRPGENYEVIEEDDGSGWTTLRNASGLQGMAPTSYLTITAGSAGNGDQLTSKRKGPAVAPKRGAKRVEYVEALYDYVADDDNELSIQAGDKIVLVQADTDGSGWTEGELDGQKGLFPTAYVKRI